MRTHSLLLPFVVVVVVGVFVVVVGVVVVVVAFVVVVTVCKKPRSCRQ